MVSYSFYRKRGFMTARAALERVGRRDINANQLCWGLVRDLLAAGRWLQAPKGAWNRHVATATSSAFKTADWLPSTHQYCSALRHFPSRVESGECKRSHCDKFLCPCPHIQASHTSIAHKHRIHNVQVRFQFHWYAGEVICRPFPLNSVHYCPF